MGITSELVRSVFSKSHGHQTIHSGSEKKKWKSSVRSYLCGDELNSVLETEDSASARNSSIANAGFSSFRSNVATNTSNYVDIDTISMRSSEATVDQPLSIASKLENGGEREEEDAAMIIQSAFRNFMARRGVNEEKFAAATPSRESIATSVEVQTGNSIKEERVDERGAVLRRAGAQALKIQEDWDDSTVSSVISKMRMQNKLEAATRRERALAYAFSQQLRICSKKKQITPNGEEPNMGWSWLERWMAARQPEMSFIQDSTSKSLVKKRIMDEDMEESCGSNEVSSLVEVCNNKNVMKPISKGRVQAKRSFSRQNSASSHLSPKESKVRI